MADVRQQQRAPSPTGGSPTNSDGGGGAHSISTSSPKKSGREKRRRTSSLKGFAEFVGNHVAAAGPTRRKAAATSHTTKRLLHSFGLLGCGVALSGIMVLLLAGFANLEWAVPNDDGVPVLNAKVLIAFGVTGSICFSVAVLPFNTAQFTESSAGGPSKAMWSAAVGLVLAPLIVLMMIGIGHSSSVSHYSGGTIFGLFVVGGVSIFVDGAVRVRVRKGDIKKRESLQAAAKITPKKQGEGRIGSVWWGFMNTVIVIGICCAYPFVIIPTFLSAGTPTRLVMGLLIHPFLLETAEVIMRTSNVERALKRFRNGKDKLAMAEARIVQSSLVSYALKQFMSFNRRFMLLNMGSADATIAALVAAAIEEALSRGFIAEMDTLMRRLTRHPKLLGDELVLQRQIWMCDANLSAIAEFNAILFTTYAQVILQRHAVVIALGYGAPSARDAAVLDVASVFVQLLLELTLEVVVDTAAMWAESEHGIPVTDYFQNIHNLWPLLYMLAVSVVSVCVTLIGFLRAPTFVSCPASSNVCHPACLKQIMFAGWYDGSCAIAGGQNISSLDYVQVSASAAGDMFANVDPITIVVALVSGLAMLLLIGLSVLFVRYRVSSTKVSGLELKVHALSAEAAKAQAVVDEVLSDTYQFDVRMQPYLIKYADLDFHEKLGEGSFGEVWRGTLRGSDDVAIKRVRMTRVTGMSITDFRAECEIMLQLRHPNLVLFHGAVYKDGPDRLALVLEYAANGTVAALLNSSGRDMKWEHPFAGIMHGLVACVAYLHGRSPLTIHRDIKTENVLVSAEWEAKVADFGTSTTIDAYSGENVSVDPHTMTFAGTPAWMAPEVLFNECYDETVDIYSLGLILLETIVGKAGYVEDFYIEHGPNMLIANPDDFYPPIPQRVRKAHPEVVAIIEVCCQKDASKRPAAPAILNLLEHAVASLGGGRIQSMDSDENESSITRTDGIPAIIRAREWAAHSSKAFIGFLSHHKASTAMEARFMKMLFEKMFSVKNSFFLGSFDQILSQLVYSDNLRSLGSLLEHVASCEVLLLLQSVEIFERPWCLLEIYTAIVHGVPIVPVVCAGRGYDFAKATSLLTHLDTVLEIINPGATKTLIENGVEPLRLGYVLSKVVPTLISQSFNASESREVIHGQMIRIVKAIHAASPSPPPDDAGIDAWTANRGKPPELREPDGNSALSTFKRAPIIKTVSMVRVESKAQRVDEMSEEVRMLKAELAQARAQHRADIQRKDMQLQKNGTEHHEELLEELRTKDAELQRKDAELQKKAEEYHKELLEELHRKDAEMLKKEAEYRDELQRKEATLAKKDAFIEKLVDRAMMASDTSTRAAA